MENLFHQKMMSISGLSIRLSCVVLAALVSACVSTPDEAPKTDLISDRAAVVALPSAPEARLALTADALQALQDAEAVIAKAAAVHALWPIASEKIAAARIAAKKFNSAAVFLYAKQAQELAQLGLKQKTYPMISITNQPKGT